jgi:DNA polymerase-3 subunit delta'
MNIVGHKKILDLLNKAVAKNSVSQAYLFSGPSGVGKFQVALYFAEKILGRSSDRINDNLVILETEKEMAPENSMAGEKKDKKDKAKNAKKEIKVEEVRELRRKLFLSSEIGKKVAIIRGAEKLNKSSQNALLKILEEPNQGLTLILVADEEKKLFPTIISRCQKIRFSVATDEEIEQLIDAQGKKLSAKNRQALIFWSLGRPGQTLEMLNDPEKLELKIKSLAEAKNLFQKTVLEKFILAENLAKDPSSTLEKMNIWMVGMRGMLLKGEWKEISREKSLEILEKISESQKLLNQTNANAKLVLENLLLAFSQR